MSADSVVFLSCFLPLTVVLHRLIPRQKGRNVLLLVASLLFYSFGSISGLLVLFVSAGINYLVARLIAKSRRRKFFSGIMIGANLALLIFYKYLDFFLCSILSLPKAVRIAIPSRYPFR